MSSMPNSHSLQYPFSANPTSSTFVSHSVSFDVPILGSFKLNSNSVSPSSTWVTSPESTYHDDYPFQGPVVNTLSRSESPKRISQPFSTISPYQHTHATSKFSLDKVPPPCRYIDKLYRLVDNPDYQEVIDWTIDGKSIVIVMNDRFVKTILGGYFRTKKINSFIRQLNGHGFRRSYVTRGYKLLDHNNSEVAVFTHPHFQRNRRELHLIRRGPSFTIGPILSHPINSDNFLTPRIVDDSLQQTVCGKIEFKRTHRT